MDFLSNNGLKRGLTF